MKLLKICFLICFLATFNGYSQGTCATALPFCANNTSGETFPAGVNTSSEAGPDYDCLLTTPNPAWYYFQVSQSGSIIMGINGTGGADVDFICWGPFNSPTGNCGNLNTGTEVDCSYSASATETCTIPNGVTGQYYILLLTNYANVAQNINFNQVGGTGSTNCNLISAVTSATVCSGTPATIYANTNLQNPTFNWSPGGQTTQTITVSPGTTTVYTVTINGTNAANQPTTTVNTGTVTVNQAPVVTVPPTLSMCDGSSVNVTSTVTPAGSYNYSWSTGATSANISVSTTTVVSLTATNTANGCVSNVATCSVTANPNPTVTTYPQINICNGATVVITPTVTGGQPTYNYAWTPAGLGSSSTASVSSSGVYNVQVTDQNSCVGTSQFTVSTSQPTVNITASPSAICGTNSSTLTTSLAGADTYSWSNGATTSTTTVNSPGTYSVEISVNGCTATATTTISTNPTPTVTLPATVSMCAGSTNTLSTISITPSGSYSYTWSTGATTSSITVSSTDGTVSLVVTDINTGCISNVSNITSVVANPNPTVTVANTNICGGSSGTVTPTINGGSPAYTYNWSNGLGTASVATVSSAGVYSVQVTDQNLCSGSAQFTVSSTQPTVSIAVNPTSICGAGSVTLTPSLIGATSYSWSNGDTNDTTIVTTAGTYSLVISVNSCTASASGVVVINPTPTVTIPNHAGMCSGASATVSTTSISPSSSYSYLWSNGSTSSSIAVNTTGTVNVVVTDNVTGCSSLASNVCTIVAAANPTVNFASATVPYCAGTTATLTPVVTGGTPSYSYTWSPASLGSNATATVNTNGVYSVLVVDSNKCSATANVIAASYVSSVNLSASDLLLCPGECTTLNANGASTYTPGTYSWSNGASTSNTVSVCSAGVYTVTYKDATNCASTASITINNDVIPVASFTSTPGSPVKPDEPIIFTSTSTMTPGSITSEIWSFGDGNNALGNSVYHAYEGAGTFVVSLVVTGSNGCMDTVSVSYVVDALLTIPNVFTPNGDGANEFLKFKNLEYLGSNHIAIFNRWGKKIFEQDNYKNDWNGGGYNDGTYFFILSVPEASPSEYQGYFQIIK